MSALRVGITRGGKAFTLPVEVVTATMAVLAKKGAGKTYTAGVIEEEFAKKHLPFVVLDPVGVHYGLRSSADGKSPGYPVAVFGGLHADVPLHQKMGHDLATTIVKENISAIIDLSELSKTAWREFVRDFCKSMFMYNKTPRHIFIEEATEFVPQRQMTPGMQETYEAVERMIRLGRNRGIGVTLIAQRSAQVAKDCLSQIDILVALRHTGKHDRDAIVDAIKDDLDDEQLARDLPAFKNGVTSLADGEAWVWWPKNRIFEQVKVRTRETFHGGATPTFGKNVQPVMAVPDLDVLRERFAKVIEEREADDPRKLQARIRTLESTLRAVEDRLAHLKAQPACPDGEHQSSASIRADMDRLIYERDAVVNAYKANEKTFERVMDFVRNVRGAVDEVGAVEFVKWVRPPETEFKQHIVVPPKNVAEVAREVVKYVDRAMGRDPKPLTEVFSGIPVQYDLSSSQQKLLDALAAFVPLGLTEVTRGVAAAHAGVSARTGSFRNNVSKLFTLGLITKPGADTLALTSAGQQVANHPDAPATLKDVHDAWRNLLSGSQVNMVNVLIKDYPETISRENLAARVEVSPQTGSFRNNLSKLRTLGIMRDASPTTVVATELLFPTGVH